MIFICYSGCSTCQKARRWLDENKIAYTSRDIKKDNPKFEELSQWYKKSGLSLDKFFNTHGKLYRTQGLKQKLPSLSDEEKLKLLATDGLMVKRPVLVGDDFVLVGFDQSEWENKLTKK